MIDITSCLLVLAEADSFKMATSLVHGRIKVLRVSLRHPLTMFPCWLITTAITGIDPTARYSALQQCGISTSVETSNHWHETDYGTLRTCPSKMPPPADASYSGRPMVIRHELIRHHCNVCKCFMDATVLLASCTHFLVSSAAKRTTTCNKGLARRSSASQTAYDCSGTRASRDEYQEPV